MITARFSSIGRMNLLHLAGIIADASAADPILLSTKRPDKGDGDASASSPGEATRVRLHLGVNPTRPAGCGHGGRKGNLHQKTERTLHHV